MLLYLVVIVDLKRSGDDGLVSAIKCLYYSPGGLGHICVFV